jgi:hypothetical protein
VAKIPAPRAGERVSIKGKPLPFSYWPMYKGTRRYGLHSRLYVTNPWAVIEGSIKQRCPANSRAEALASARQAEQFFKASRAELVSHTSASIILRDVHHRFSVTEAEDFRALARCKPYSAFQSDLGRRRGLFLGVSLAFGEQYRDAPDVGNCPRLVRNIGKWIGVGYFRAEVAVVGAITLPWEIGH